MADKEKKKKKPKHTSLVVPDGNKKKKKVGPGKDRLGRSVEEAPGAAPPAALQPGPGHSVPAPTSEAGGGGAQPAPPPAPNNPAATAPTTGPKPQPAAPPQPDDHDDLPPNAIVLPRRRKSRLTPKKRRRRKRRIQALVVLLLVGALVVFYVSGAWVTTATLVSDGWEGLRIAARPGDGWPMEFAVTGYITARPMGGNGFAALGKRDAAMVDASGKELWRVQHNYMSPGMSTGNTRMVVYSRGGTEYTVEGRGKTLAAHTTEHDIQFCQLSPDGWLAVVTAERNRADLDVYGPAYDASDVEFHMPLVEGRPVLARFADDNRGLLVACVSASGGALGTTTYLLRTDRAEVQAEVRAADAQILEAAWVDSSHFVAVYDQFAALYNAKGEEQARYGYGQRTLLAAHILGGRVALAFGASARETFDAVLLNDKLEPLFDRTLNGSGTVKVLAASDGAYVMCGQDVYALAADGKEAGARRLEPNTLGLVYGGEPLVLAAGLVDSVAPLLHPEAASSSPGSLSGEDASGSGTAEGEPAGDAPEPGSR